MSELPSPAADAYGNMSIDVPAGKGAGPRVAVRNAAVLLVVDRDGPAPRVLMGRRRKGMAFMADKVVFPGGRVEAADHRLANVPPLRAEVEQALRRNVPERTAPSLPRALALAAIRETAEETGILLARQAEAGRQRLSGPWAAVIGQNHQPGIDRVHFFARATTPPGLNRRFDTRFFLADAGDLLPVDPAETHGELHSIAWPTFAEARATDLPAITRIILDEAERRLDELAGGRLTGPVPYFRMRNGQRDLSWIPLAD